MCYPCRPHEAIFKKPSRDSNHTGTTESEVVIPTETLANEIEQPVTQPTAETIVNKTHLIKERRSKSEERPLLPPSDGNLVFFETR